MRDSTHPKNETALTRGRAQASNAAEPSSRLGGDPSSTGASPSNTAPAKYLDTQNVPRILRYGVDSLYLSYRGSLDVETDFHLDQLKNLAQSDDPADKVQAVYEVGNHCFELKGRGRGRFPYVLADNWFDVQLSRASSTSLPLAMVQVSSELLTLGSLSSAVSDASAVVQSFGSPGDSIGVSRVDLCVDFEPGFDLEVIPRIAWVTRAKSFQNYWDQNQYSGCSIGQGGSLSCRLYNKSLELKKTNKVYLHDVWRDAGWVGEHSVWRLEFQFRRPVLKELGVLTVDDLSANLDGLWKYAMTDWLYLTMPGKDSNRSRWPIHPLWTHLRDEPWSTLAQAPLYRVSQSRDPSDERLFIHGLGFLSSFMASRGLTDIDEGFAEYKKQAHEYHIHKTHRTNRTLTLAAYVQEKVKSKSRKYNRLRDKKHRLARAKAYRLRKSGE